MLRDARMKAQRLVISGTFSKIRAPTSIGIVSIGDSDNFVMPYNKCVDGKTRRGVSGDKKFDVKPTVGSEAQPHCPVLVITCTCDLD